MQIAASQTNGGTDSSAAVLDTLDIRRSIAVRAGLWSAVRSSEYKSIISSTVHPFASHAFASDTALGVGVRLVASPGLRAAARIASMAQSAANILNICCSRLSSSLPCTCGELTLLAVESMAERELKRARRDSVDDDEPPPLDASQTDDELPPLALSQTDNPTPFVDRRGASARGGGGGFGGGVSFGGAAAAVVCARAKREKQIYDRVHGPIVVPGLLVAFIDTPEFQRLDRIAQLGGCRFVYPSATHSRKEHSIGVAHLAGKLVRHLRDVQPSLGIDDDDVRCVELAGLIHDIGHGPFSHMFEHVLEHVLPAEKVVKHEVMSGELARHLVTANEIDLRLYFDGDPEQQLEFAIALVDGLEEDKEWECSTKGPRKDHPGDDAWGRPEAKRFLFDIVANKRNGVDVDKLDYLVRDSLAAFGSKPAAFDVNRVLASARALPNDLGRREVCFQMKVAYDIIEVYQQRAKLHRTLYQHHTGNVAEEMICDILVAADAHCHPVCGAGGVQMRLSEAAVDPASFAELNDSILDIINNSPEEGLGDAKRLIRRLRCRDFYKPVGAATHLPTQPRCSQCRHETHVLDRNCRHCGHRTRDRLALPKLESGDVVNQVRGAMTSGARAP